MIITAIRTHILEAPLSRPFAYSRAWYDTRTAMVVEIESDDGLVRVVRMSASDIRDDPHIAVAHAGYGWPPPSGDLPDVSILQSKNISLYQK